MQVEWAEASGEELGWVARLHRETLAEELRAGGLPAPLVELLVEGQLRGREQSWRSRFPEMRALVLRVQAELVGAVVVERGAAQVSVIDLVVVPGWRGLGVGAAVLRRVQEEAGSLPVALSVRRDNPARRLYLRLGFVEGEGDAVHVAMRWQRG